MKNSGKTILFSGKELLSFAITGEGLLLVNKMNTVCKSRKHLDKSLFIYESYNKEGNSPRNNLLQCNALYNKESKSSKYFSATFFKPYLLALSHDDIAIFLIVESGNLKISLSLNSIEFSMSSFTAPSK